MRRWIGWRFWQFPFEHWIWIFLASLQDAPIILTPEPRIKILVFVPATLQVAGVDLTDISE